MLRLIRAATWLVGALVAMVLTTAAWAESGPDGYRSAEFGMSFEAVMAALEDDEGVVNLTVSETDDGDVLIDGELRADDAAPADLRYVFPAGSDALALVLNFYSDVAQRDALVARLTSRHGQPWEEEMAEWWFEQLKAGMPEPPQSLMVWGGDGDETAQRGRLVRLWTFADYLSVEYLDTQRFE